MLILLPMAIVSSKQIFSSPKLKELEFAFEGEPIRLCFAFPSLSLTHAQELRKRRRILASTPLKIAVRFLPLSLKELSVRGVVWVVWERNKKIE